MSNMFKATTAESTVHLLKLVTQSKARWSLLCEWETVVSDKHTGNIAEAEAREALLVCDVRQANRRLRILTSSVLQICTG